MTEKPAPSGDLRDQIREALTREHYRRARERIEASPEEHCAAFADAVLPIIEGLPNRGYCEHCGRGDCAPTAEQYHQLTQRAEQAERERDEYRERFTNQITAGSELVEKLQQAEAAVRRVRGVHNGGSAENTVLCVACCEVLPCPTLRALDAEQPEETPRRLTEQQGGIPNDAYTADDYPKGM